MSINHDGTIQRDPAQLEPDIATAEIKDNAVTDAKISSHTSTKIVGLPTQTSDLNMGNQDLTNVGVLNLGDGSGYELTISSGEITVTKSYHWVDTESDAATDDLDTINGGSVGDILTLRAEDGTRTVVCKHGTGNLKLDGGADFSLDNGWDTITFICGFSGYWFEISRSDNG